MKSNYIQLIREGLKKKVKRKKPSPEKLRKIYMEALQGRSLFIQTDYLPDLVSFLDEHNMYEHRALDRNFQPIPLPIPVPPIEELDPAIV